jgi:hypothetical protein
VHIAQRNQKRGVKEKSVNREKHEKDKMTEDSNTALTMLDADSILIMKRTSECRINEHVWKRHNAYGRRSISCICWLPIDVFIDLNKGTVYLSSELFPFFCMYIVLPFSTFLLYALLQFLTLLASMRIAIFRQHRLATNICS